MRDRAVSVFALITGMHISHCNEDGFDRNNKLIDQNPGDGVSPKFKNMPPFSQSVDGPENIYGMV